MFLVVEPSLVPLTPVPYVIDITIDSINMTGSRFLINVPPKTLLSPGCIVYGQINIGATEIKSVSI